MFTEQDSIFLVIGSFLFIVIVAGTSRSSLVSYRSYIRQLVTFDSSRVYTTCTAPACARRCTTASSQRLTWWGHSRIGSKRTRTGICWIFSASFYFLREPRIVGDETLAAVNRRSIAVVISVKLHPQQHQRARSNTRFPACASASAVQQIVRAAYYRTSRRLWW